MKRVAVIGAGVCGLSAIKSCKEEGIDVICFEKTGRMGGLWHYHDNDEVDVPSCMKTTIINSSKEMSAFSDFPPPKEFPNYMHNRLMLMYFQMYAEKFALLQHIKYHHDVVRVVQSEDYSATGRWLVIYKNEQGIEQEVFDGVMICIGHHVTPHVPAFPGLDKFEGKVIHSHSLKTADAFNGSQVLVIGSGNSGLDASVDISAVAKQVYLSTRRGFWLLFRLGTKGLPIDAEWDTRFRSFLGKCMGFRMASYLAEYLLNQRFDHETYRIKPKHHVLSQHPSINDHLPEKILSGSVKIKRDISRFVERGVIFKEDGGSVTEIDAVVLATGYKITYPFLSEDILPSTNNQVNLYKHAFPSNLPHPSLVVIGLIQPFGCIFPIAESQSRWYAQLMNGKVKLPPRNVMMEHIRKRKEEMAKRYFDSPRHTVQGDYVPFMDDIAIEYGAKPNLFKMAFTDPILFWKCAFGPCLAYQYRLVGPHPWRGARQAILSYEERLLYPLQGPTMSRSHRLSDTKNILYFVFFFFVTVLILFV